MRWSARWDQRSDRWNVYEHGLLVGNSDDPLLIMIFVILQMELEPA